MRWCATQTTLGQRVRTHSQAETNYLLATVEVNHCCGLVSFSRGGGGRVSADSSTMWECSAASVMVPQQILTLAGIKCFREH